MAAAIDCFARHGYQGTSIDRIARDAGVTKGAVYCHFRDKEDLLFETVTDRVSGFENRILMELAPGDDLRKAFKAAAEACFFTATVSNHRRFIITLLVEALDTNPRLSAEFRAMLRRMRGFLGKVIRAGQGQGVFRREVDPETAASVFIGGIMGAEIQYYQDPAEADLRELLDLLVEQTVGWLEVHEVGSGAGKGGMQAW